MLERILGLGKLVMVKMRLANPEHQWRQELFQRKKADRVVVLLALGV